MTELVAMSAGDSAAQPYSVLAAPNREIEGLRGGLQEAQACARQMASLQLPEAS